MDGGSPITNYNIYIDDGNGGSFQGPYSSGLATTWNSGLIPPNSSLLPLIAGKIYRVKYSAVNVQGEGPLSQ